MIANLINNRISGAAKPGAIVAFTTGDSFLGGNMKKIQLTQGKFALVDDSDFNWLNQFNWFAAKQRSRYVAVRNCRCFNKKRHLVYMHRQIMFCPQDKQIDHIDHTGLDNRRSNLRICTNAENRRNSEKIKNVTSIYKGVWWRKDRKKWRGQITLNSKDISLGCFNSEIEAALAYDKAARYYFGEFAYLNFPNWQQKVEAKK